MILFGGCFQLVKINHFNGLLKDLCEYIIGYTWSYDEN